jgi:hypothetical protein
MIENDCGVVEMVIIKIHFESGRVKNLAQQMMHSLSFAWPDSFFFRSAGIDFDA